MSFPPSKFARLRCSSH